MISVVCRNIALMITDSQKCKRKVMKTEGIEKKNEEKLDISISNHETGFLTVLRFIAFTILVTFKNFVFRP